MIEHNLLTSEGLSRLKEELDYLKATKRKEVSETIKQALSFGDLSENSEYDEAKNEQAKVEARIIEIENIIKDAKVIDKEDLRADVVNDGSEVTVLDMEFDEECHYEIVGSTEADPLNGKISSSSPLGMALKGHKAGDIVEVAAPAGMLKFKVLKIGK